MLLSFVSSSKHPKLLSQSCIPSSAVERPKSQALGRCGIYSIMGRLTYGLFVFLLTLMLSKRNLLFKTELYLRFEDLC